VSLSLHLALVHVLIPFSERISICSHKMAANSGRSYILPVSQLMRKEQDFFPGGGEPLPLIGLTWSCDCYQFLISLV
jgi:hypothetical protein